MARLFRIAAATLLLAAPLALSADTGQDIRAVLDYYAEMWNDKDIESIAGYYHPEFVLITGEGPVRRQQRMEDMRVILADGKDQGELSYSQVRVEALGSDHAVAYGQVSLQFKDGSSIENWFTTTYRKTPFGWKALLSYN